MSAGPKETDALLADQFAATRRALEEAVIALVHSIDGRLFSFSLPLTGESPKAGDFVRLCTEDDAFLGQVVSAEVQLRSSGEVSCDLPSSSIPAAADQRLVARPTLRVLVGQGAILAAEAEGYAPLSRPRPFANATISPVRSSDIAAYARAVRAKGGRPAVGEPRARERDGSSGCTSCPRHSAPANSIPTFCRSARTWC